MIAADASTSAQHIQTLVALLASVVFIVTTVLAGGRWVINRYLKPNQQMVEEWSGDEGNPRKGIPPRLGALERITVLERAMSQVQGQVTRNGGSSLLDKVESIKQTIDAQGSGPQ